MSDESIGAEPAEPQPTGEPGAQDALEKLADDSSPFEPPPLDLVTRNRDPGDPETRDGD